VFLLLGMPLAIVGAKFGRRFAMFGARARSLGGLGAGWLASLFSLTRFAFFDLSVIWGHALFGAILIVAVAYCGAVLLLDLPDERLQPILVTCVVAGVLLGVLGAITQIRGPRFRPGHGDRGEY
jgi:hypothetical protein